LTISNSRLKYEDLLAFKWYTTTLSTVTFIIMTLSMKGLFVTLRVSAFVSSAVMLKVILLSLVGPLKYARICCNKEAENLYFIYFCVSVVFPPKFKF
jgi:hypothetical protein